MSTTFIDFLRTGFAHNPATLGPARVASLVRLAWQVQRERNQLAKLSASELADMGIHPAHGERESKRGLTDLPKNRLDRL